MTDDRDPVVSQVLRELPVPEHGPDFWAQLQRRLADEPAPAAAEAGAAGLARPDDDEGEPIAVAVAVAGTDRRRRPVWLVSVAAVLLLVVGAATTLANRQPRSERVRTADAPHVPAPDGQTTATTVARPSTEPATADEAVVAWLEAVGAGDTARAAGLTGPRSKAYVEALTGGGSIEGFLTEAGEGYGAWADSPDRSTTEVELDVEGDELVVVVVSGTWTGEGGTAFRTDALPVLRSGGAWLVEPWAIDPATGGRISVASPTPADGGGFDGLTPDGTLSASAPGAGTFHFSLDDEPATVVRGWRDSGGVRATFDPPGAMASRTHLFVIAYVDGQTVSAVAGTFLVEG